MVHRIQLFNFHILIYKLIIKINLLHVKIWISLTPNDSLFGVSFRLVLKINVTLAAE